MTAARTAFQASFRMQGHNPHAIPSVSPAALITGLLRNRVLIAQMARREVVGRYQGSVMGLAWSFLHPVFMLTVYTFVFSEVFGMRWGQSQGEGGKAQFALILFVGLIVHALFSEVLNRAPGLILNNVNYVKKVVFPLEVLPAILVLAALFHAAVSLVVLQLAFGVLHADWHWTALLAPLVLAPLLILALGLAWMLAALGVYLRDIGQTMGIVTSVLLFLSPVFYPMSAVPERFQPFILANPLTFIIEQARAVLIWGRMPDWIGLGCYALVSAAVAWAGYAWFQKTRKGFADVL